MRLQRRFRVVTLMLLGSISSWPAAAPAADDAIVAAVAGAHRSEANRARDAARHPVETLTFFGLRPDMTVVEIWPGNGWYTEILAHVLKDKGRLYAAHFDLDAPYGYQRRSLGAFFTLLGTTPDMYRQVRVSEFGYPFELELAPAGSVDMVLTFRNVHNWVGPQFEGAHFGRLAFDAIYAALKPGGVLGVVDHRWPDPSTEDPLARNGYISAERTIALAEAAGFELAAQSEINANPADTRDYPSGVWTLPPTLALGDQDRDRYLGIGESDRFTLKFVKPLD